MAQLTVGDVLLSLEALQRVHGPDVPLWGAFRDLRGTVNLVPIAALRLETTAGTPAVLLCGVGVTLGEETPCPHGGETECDDTCTAALLATRHTKPRG